MLVSAQIGTAPSNWDADIKDRGDLPQTTYWGSVLSKLDRSIPVFLEVLDGDIRIAKMLIFHAIPWDRKQNAIRKDFIGRFMRKGFIRAYGAPVFFTDDADLTDKGTQAIIRWIEKYADDKKLLYIELNETFARHYTEFDILQKYEKRKWATLIVDLGQEDLWNSISAAARKSINKAKREEVTVRKITSFEEYIDSYIRNYNSFNGRETIDADIEQSQVVWEQDVDQYYKYYVALKDNQVIGVLGMYIFNGVATEIMSALSPEAFERKLPAQDLLHWEMFMEARELGCHSFDLAGINPDPKTPKEAGIRRFKEKWNGSYIEYYNYSKITQPILRKAYAIYKEIKKARG